MASGLCVVSTRVGGIPYAFADGVDCLLVERNDGAAMATAVRSLLADPALAGRLSRAGRATAERFALPTIVGEWRRMLTALAGGPS